MLFPITVDIATEVIRVKVSAERADEFVNGRYAVDSFMKTLQGFVGTELLQCSGEDWLILIRWADKAAVLAAQEVTASADVITHWLSTTSSFVSFETAYVKYLNVYSATDPR